MAAEAIGTLLTVEDDEEIRALTAMHARAQGFHVLEAGDGEAALEVIRRDPPDIIVSDMRMPKKDGLTLLKELREAGDQVPFLFVSAFTNKEYTIRALSLGAFDYLEKPFLPNEFKALTQEMMRVRNAQREAFSKLGISDQVMVGKSSPEGEILKMVTLRKDGDVISVQQTIGSNHKDQRSKILALFVTETQTQLNQGLKALRKDRNNESPGWQLGYLFRLMHAIHSTAVSMSLDDIHNLTIALEHSYAVLRVRTSYINPMTLATLQAAHELLFKHLDYYLTGRHAQLQSFDKRELMAETSAMIEDLKVVGLPR